MFDEQPDGDPHGECAAEIHKLEAAVEHWRDEWSEVCNENQLLINTCDEANAYIKTLIAERDIYIQGCDLRADEIEQLERQCKVLRYERDRARV